VTWLIIRSRVGVTTSKQQSRLNIAFLSCKNQTPLWAPEKETFPDQSPSSDRLGVSRLVGERPEQLLAFSVELESVLEHIQVFVHIAHDVAVFTDLRGP
jgi:hypothetical protein